MATEASLADGATLAADRDGSLRRSSSGRRRCCIGIVTGLAVLVLFRACRQRKEFRGAADKTGRAKVRLEVLGKIIGSTEELAAGLDGALVRTLLCMGAIVTLEVFHPLEALAAVANVELVSRADNERRRTGVSSTTSRRGARDRSRNTSASAIEHRSIRAIVDWRAERDHAVASVARHLRRAVVRVEAGRHEVVGGSGRVHKATSATINTRDNG